MLLALIVILLTMRVAEAQAGIDDNSSALCTRQGYRLFGQTCSSTAQCCTYGGASITFCSPLEGLCTWCPNPGHRCRTDADCCPGDPTQKMYGKSFCNTTLGICIGCGGAGDPCVHYYQVCCKTANLTCRYDARMGWDMCFS